jgi:ribonuclease D
MKIITKTDDLAIVCQNFAEHDYVTVDTEFLRESTFWPILCLIQLAGPDDALIVDAMAEGLDLGPFFELMGDESVTKVFHAARQDIEIVHNLGNLIPHPVFDTQVAAMVCGYGDSIAYDQLVSRVNGAHIDKSSRFTDWSRRPLTQKQLDYALADVTHLRDVYHSLTADLEKNGRAHWVSEEMKVLTSVRTYDMPVEDAWRRLKMRVRKPLDFAIMRAVAEWRESAARARNIPRGRVIKDDAIFAIAQQHPKNTEALGRVRAVPNGFERSRHAASLIETVQKAMATPQEDLIPVPRPSRSPEGSGAATEMLKVLLKLTVEKHGVAAKVVATVDDLERIAANDDADVAPLKGWRRDMFGENALKLKNGQLALGFINRKIALIELESSESDVAE